MWKSSRWQNIGTQSPYSEVLLANMRSDAVDYVRKCDRCQQLAPVLRSPAQDLISMTSLWPLPFAQWGIDIVGPLPTTLAQKKLLPVATDFFIKWIEAEAFALIKDKDVT